MQQRELRLINDLSNVVASGHKPIALWNRHLFEERKSTPRPRNFAVPPLARTGLQDVRHALLSTHAALILNKMGSTRRADEKRRWRAAHACHHGYRSILSAAMRGLRCADRDDRR